jgi:hypothetical protein
MSESNDAKHIRLEVSRLRRLHTVMMTKGLSPDRVTVGVIILDLETQAQDGCYTVKVREFLEGNSDEGCDLVIEVIAALVQDGTLIDGNRGNPDLWFIALASEFTKHIETEAKVNAGDPTLAAQLAAIAEAAGKGRRSEPGGSR